MENAIQMLTTLTTKIAKEKYLNDNFDQTFIEKLYKKVPQLLEDTKTDKKKGKNANNNNDTINAN